MRRVILMTLVLSALSACSWLARPERVAVAAPAPTAPEEPDPFDHGSTSFLVAGARFTAGETAIVKVCVAPGGIIASADLVLPSGDKRFDDFAVNWARQVKLASAPQGPQEKQLCGPVRVEIRVSPVPRVLSGGDSSLG